MSTSALVIVVVVAVVLAGIGYAAFLDRCYLRIACGLLEKWARTAGCKVLFKDRRWLDTGPFPIPMNGQVILRFRALDAHQREISGWARACLAFREKFDVQLD